MKLLIEISERDYEVFKQLHLNKAEQIIANGTPLPEHHGRLIDAEELLQYGSCPDDCTGSNSPECNEVAHCPIRIFDIESINDAPTIIEADKEGAKE